MDIRNIVRVAVYTSITFISTVLLVVETPATGGYFNLGEASIYVISSLSTPMLAAVAAGLGPALADLVLGYWYFAPATLVIKFCEGYVASSLIRAVRRGSGKTINLVRLLTVLLGLVIAATVYTMSLGAGGYGVEFGWTQAQVLSIPIPVPYIRVELHPIVWLVVGILTALLSIVIATISRARPTLLPMAVGGLVMVAGYFLYEYFISNPLILGRPALGALVEIPVNIGQFTVGMLIAYPVVQFIERATGGEGS
ncbi:MAG: ECF transporter S component [Ignisphaera sp.]|nr:ECF transporter S component [Ignisphaera sp.]